MEQSQMCVLANIRPLHMACDTSRPWLGEKETLTHVSGLKVSQLLLQKAFQESFSQIR